MCAFVVYSRAAQSWLQRENLIDTHLWKKKNITPELQAHSDVKKLLLYNTFLSVVPNLVDWTLQKGCNTNMTGHEMVKQIKINYTTQNLLYYFRLSSNLSWESLVDFTWSGSIIIAWLNRSLSGLDICILCAEVPNRQQHCLGGCSSDLSRTYIELVELQENW